MSSRANGITPVKGRKCEECGGVILAEDMGICPTCAAEYCGCGMTEGCIDGSPE